ncbi:MAG: M23 family metallopeptidase [bacterium]|nr:M23 family metallopeptidase [bacterium]
MLTASALLLTGATATADSGCAESTDTEIYALIDTLTTAGAAITIDGADSDWSAFPNFPDAIDDLPGIPGQEIVAGSIAPLADRIKVFARTAGVPPTTDGAFAVSLDVSSTPALEAQLVLNPVGGFHALILFDLENQPILPPTIFIPVASVGLAFGADFIEVEIPYSVLSPYIPDLLAPVQRSWVRGGIGSVSGAAVLDFGPGTTSFRLIPTPYDLDPALPFTANAPRQLSLPLDGQWFITQGAFGAFSHSTYWAYDFSLVDNSFNRASPPGSTDNLDYFAFGEPLYAPAAGTVTQAVGTNPDSTPPTASGAPHNIVEIDIGGGLFASMLHERQSSVIVIPTEVVAESQQVAEVGNSGYSSSAHLHLEINEAGGGLGASIRGVELTNVRVSLNPVVNDPWERECAEWEIRGGFLVESLPPLAPAVPLLGSTGLSVLIGSLLAAGIVAGIRRKTLTARS